MVCAATASASATKGSMENTATCSAALATAMDVECVLMESANVTQSLLQTTVPKSGATSAPTLSLELTALPLNAPTIALEMVFVLMASATVAPELEWTAQNLSVLVTAQDTANVSTSHANATRVGLDSIAPLRDARW